MTIQFIIYGGYVKGWFSPHRLIFNLNKAEDVAIPKSSMETVSNAAGFIMAKSWSVVGWSWDLLLNFIVRTDNHVTDQNEKPQNVKLNLKKEANLPISKEKEEASEYDWWFERK